ncbi:hypothetical protein Tco_0971751 [Tanacetum coccineum]
MANFPLLQELADAKNSNNLTDTIRVNERRLLTTKLNAFGACRRTHCNHTAEDDLEVFSTDDLGLDSISALNFPHVL